MIALDKLGSEVPPPPEGEEIPTIGDVDDDEDATTPPLFWPFPTFAMGNGLDCCVILRQSADLRGGGGGRRSGWILLLGCCDDCRVSTMSTRDGIGILLLVWHDYRKKVRFRSKQRINKSMADTMIISLSSRC